MSIKDWLEKDYYASLGVPKDADAATIKRAYRKLAKAHHPDRNPGNLASEEKFKAVSEAYDVLSDTDQRKQYDEARAMGPMYNRFGAGGQAAGQGARGSSGTAGGGVPFDVDDLLRQANEQGGNGSLGDLLGGIFNRGGRGSGGASSAPVRGADLEASLTVSFSQAVEGATMPLRMTSDVACETCHGDGAAPGTVKVTCATCQGTGQTTRNAGAFAFSEPCRVCRGQGKVPQQRCVTCSGVGRVSRSRTLQVRLPTGVLDGARIRVGGQGQPGIRGGPKGDLYVTIGVRPHPVFARREDDLILTVPITFPEAGLGAEIPVPLLGGGQVTVRIPPGTTSGRTFRVRGHGGWNREGRRGDLLVSVVVSVPQKLSAAAQAALEGFKAATAEDDPRRGLSTLASQD